MKILGFQRPDGQLGIRNKVSIIFTTDCSRFVAQKLKLLFPQGTQIFGYPGGCAFQDGPVNKLTALGNHSSSAAALVIGLGCEGTDAYKIADAIAQTGRPAEALKINEAGGDIMTVEKGSHILVEMIQNASMSERVEMSPADLVVGSECGGSDSTSGLASNPLTGAAGDHLIDAGGTYMHEEVSELMGCADVLAERDGVAHDHPLHGDDPERDKGVHHRAQHVLAAYHARVEQSEAWHHQHDKRGRYDHPGRVAAVQAVLSERVRGRQS